MIGLGLSGAEHIASAVLVSLPLTEASSSSSVQPTVTSPTDYVVGVKEGVGEQVHQVDLGLHNTVGSLAPDAEFPAGDPAAPISWTSDTAAEHIGFYEGMMLAQKVEGTITKMAAT